MNKVFLVGRLASDPIVKQTTNGMNFCQLTVACEDNRNQNQSYFFPCVAWQNNANFIGTYIKKGDLVEIDGKLTRRSYVSKEGKNVYVTEIVVDNVKILSSSRKNNQNTNSTVNINAAFENKPNAQFTTTENKIKNFDPTNDELDWIEEIKE